MISGYPTSFGLFYPVGYLVVGFKNKESALQVQQDLKTGGYEDNDCTFFSCKEVTEAATENLEKSSAGFLPRLGWDDEAVRFTWKQQKKVALFS